GWWLRPLRRASDSADAHDLREDAGDVVGAPVIVRLLDELLRGRLEVGMLPKDFEDLVIGSGTCEPIAAKHVDVAGLGLIEEGIDEDGLLHAEGAKDDVFMRKVFDLFGRREPTHFDV